ncbi:hypothetical protein UC34_16675 [Pandoraea vervacti]|uniref:Na/Pi-cotransporter II-like protein n=1 Tax=Pandoraea vervacti TaxID=656178 RepID=A0ABN4U6P1_9BURK|nr:Na/Pi symporter [Pandoraea vervacti]APD11346.1 hypothetical protein UC34_16675 [Pandoraea vervacti]
MGEIVGAVSILAGGVGIFLIGMSMMTDGLKLAAGPALERILAGATRTRWQAFASGVLVTAITQSSSVVTIATIGFVNAGLLKLGGALWLMFGSNLGSTMMGWIVAVIGLKFNIDAFALPMIAVGVAMRLSGAGSRRGAIGNALAGFGLLFFGISLLQSAFIDMASMIRMPDGDGPLDVLMQVIVGFVLTCIVQSSAAAMAITLTAAQNGLLSAQGAAAVVIGANIGTTLTAVIAAIGATPNARRASMAHVAFNVVAAVVALLLLPWMIRAISAGMAWMGYETDPAIKLAIFHTTFNVLGVLLMIPLATPLLHWLQRRFRTREEDEGAPQFLDDNVLQVPQLAVDALKREVERLGAMSRHMVRGALTGMSPGVLAQEHASVTRLGSVCQSFAERMSRVAMEAAAAERLADTLRTLRYYESAAEQAIAAAALQDQTTTATGLSDVYTSFLRESTALLDHIESDALPSDGGDSLGTHAAAMEAAYGGLKAKLLADGAAGNARISVMEEALRRYSALRRALQQTIKASTRRAKGTDPID